MFDTIAEPPEFTYADAIAPGRHRLKANMAAVVIGSNGKAYRVNETGAGKPVDMPMPPRAVELGDFWEE